MVSCAIAIASYTLRHPLLDHEIHVPLPDSLGTNAVVQRRFDYSQNPHCPGENRTAYKLDRAKDILTMYPRVDTANTTLLSHLDRHHAVIPG